MDNSNSTKLKTTKVVSIDEKKVSNFNCFKNLFEEKQHFNNLRNKFRKERGYKE